MRDNKTEILIEENFRYENMTIDERNNIITFLYNTKMLNDNPDIKIVTCNFKKLQNNIYKANGAMVSNNNDAYWFDSNIEIISNQLLIKSDISCLLQNKSFKEYSTFNKIDSINYKRHTKYSNIDTQYDDDIIIDNFDIIYEDNSKKQSKR